jgi:hypothetical protein
MQNTAKKQVSDRASATRTAMSGKTFVLMANAGSQNGFFASHICSKNQAELQRRDSRPTAMMRRHDQMAPRDHDRNDTALLEYSKRSADGCPHRATTRKNCIAGALSNQRSCRE